MTIAAQHVRTALGHLRNTDSAWKPILKMVGPFTVRIESHPATWLTHFLHCRTYLDFVAVKSVLANTIPEPTNSGTDIRCRHWTPTQQEFWDELQAAQQLGNVDLSKPRSPVELTQRSQALGAILDRFESTTLARFQFYCWGELDSWPSSDPSLLKVTETFINDFPRHATDSRAAVVPAQAVEAIVASWAPYRAIAAWYLERWATNQQASRPE